MLIKCRECGKEYSDKAESCVNCGCPTVEKDELTRSFENSDGGVAVGGAYLVGMGIKNLPNMKWWQRIIFYTLFGGVLLFFSIMFIGIVGTNHIIRESLGKEYVTLIETILLFLTSVFPLLFLEFKTQKKMKAKV